MFRRPRIVLYPLHARICRFKVGRDRSSTPRIVNDSVEFLGPHHDSLHLIKVECHAEILDPAQPYGVNNLVILCNSLNVEAWADSGLIVSHGRHSPLRIEGLQDV